MTVIDFTAGLYFLVQQETKILKPYFLILYLKAYRFDSPKGFLYLFFQKAIIEYCLWQY